MAFQQVKQLVGLGHEVTVFTPKYNGLPAQVFGLQKFGRVNYLKPWIKYGNAAFCPQLIWKLRKFDIIHLHYPAFGMAEIIWLMKSLRISRHKLVIQYHMDLAGQGLLKYFFSFYTKFIFPSILKTADKIVVSSLDYAQNSVVGHLFKNHSKKLVEIPLGVDTEHFKIAEPDPGLAQKYSFGKKDKIILFVGALDRPHYFKGLDILLKAFSRMKKDFPAKLLVVGEGELKIFYQKQARSLGIQDKVVFVGKVGNDELPQFYSLANFFVLPSRDRSESFGLVILEAMASGLPVIASNLPGVRTLIDDGQDGLLVEPKDAIALAKALENFLVIDLKKEFGKKGRKKAETLYSWNSVGERLDRLYKLT